MKKCCQCEKKAHFTVACLDTNSEIDTEYILCLAHYIELSAYMIKQAQELLVQMDKN